jgi:murein DD-endopeptidase MepM/ murein hydrolase activator NlpD
MTLSRDDLEQVEKIAVYTNRRYYENVLEIFAVILTGAIAGLTIANTSPAPVATNSTTTPTGDRQNIPAGKWVKPLDKMIMTSGFGMRMHPTLKTWKPHNGTDYTGDQGDPIYAVFGGEAKIVVNSACGNGIVITAGEYSASYCHLHFVSIKPGPVKTGEKIGGVGTTGRSTGDHLHLGIKYNGNWIDPHKELQKRGLI